MTKRTVYEVKIKDNAGNVRTLVMKYLTEKPHEDSVRYNPTRDTFVQRVFFDTARDADKFLRDNKLRPYKYNLYNGNEGFISKWGDELKMESRHRNRYN